jgi:hypothetical protein
MTLYVIKQQTLIMKNIFFAILFMLAIINTAQTQTIQQFNLSKLMLALMEVYNHHNLPAPYFF